MSPPGGRNCFFQEIDFENHRRRGVNEPVISKGAVYGGFGGGVFGSMAWLVALSAIAGEYGTLAGIAVVAFLIFGVSVRLALRYPAAYFRIAIGSLAAVGIVSMAVANWRYAAWMAAFRASSHYSPSQDMSQGTMNLVLGGIFIGLTLLFLMQDRMARARIRSAKAHPPTNSPLPESPQ